jgi:VWFA-related protein
MRTNFSTALFLLLFCPLLHAQQTPAAAPAPTTTLSVDARLVSLPVVIRDKKGALIQNLTKDDFVLQVDGHAQTIRYFDIDKNLPLTLGLLVDTSQSQRNALDQERTASIAFLDQMLTSDKDKAFVMHFDSQVELLQDLTNSRPKLQAAIKEIDTSTNTSNDDNNSNNNGNNGNNGNNSGNNNGNGNNGNNGNSNHLHYSRGTTLYDAVFLAADEVMSKQRGRKALILLTDGNDHNSRENLTRAIEAAQRADTIIYAIYFKGEEPRSDNNNNQRRGGGYPGGRGGGIGFPGGGGGGYPGGGGRYPSGGGNNGGGYPSGNSKDGKKVLERMANETGGRMFEVSKKDDAASIYTQIAAELRAQYRLGYTPDAATASDGYHQIDLSLKKADQKKDYTIQTRDGYYTGAAKK